MTQSLAQLLAERNAQSLIWVCEGAMFGFDRWAGMLTEDLSHWHSMGIYTVEDWMESMRLEDEKEARKASYSDWCEQYSDEEFEAIMRAEAEEERARIADERDERVWAKLDHIQDGGDFRAPRTGRI
jgi:hypothetical protein